MNPKLVIFDCDGVLVDSEIVVHRVASRESTKIGFPLTVERAIELFSGLADEDLLGVVRKEFGSDFSDENFKHVLGEIKSAFPKDLTPVDNISKVMDYLDQRQIERCISSNGIYNEIIDSLVFTKLYSYFDKDKIFSISMGKKPKPAPDLFLHAAEKFQIKPEDSIVVEDSVVGIKAAKAAGMPVVGFLGATHAKTPWYAESIVSAEPDMIANDALDLLDIMRLLKPKKL